MSPRAGELRRGAAVDARTHPSPGLRPPSPRSRGARVLVEDLLPACGEKVPEGRMRGVSLEAGARGLGGLAARKERFMAPPHPPISLPLGVTLFFLPRRF